MGLAEEKKLVRAIRVELVKPLDESWKEAGSILRLLAGATPKLLNAALNAKIAIDVVGRDSVKGAIAPNAKAASGDGLAYQAVLREVDALRAWGKKKNNGYAELHVSSSMAAAISRAACQAHSRRDQENVRFSSERVIVRADGVSIDSDEKGFVLGVKLRSAPGKVRFAIAHSTGQHRETIENLAKKKIEHGDCKIQWDERRQKWYGLVAYKEAPRKVPDLDPERVLVVHRGIRNALYLLSSSGASASLSGSKFLFQRRNLKARSKESVSAAELGGGAKGRGRKRRFDSYERLQGKVSRITKTFCQQAAAFTAKRAVTWGCGSVVIEDYGGLPPDEDPALRRVLDRFPLYEMKTSHASRLSRDGIEMREVDGAYVSTTCPRCGDVHPSYHNRRTGIFHCRACVFERPADWVAAYWMLRRSGANMKVWDERFRRERELADAMREEKESSAEEKESSEEEKESSEEEKET